MKSNRVRCTPDKMEATMAYRDFTNVLDAIDDKVLIGDGCWPWQGRVDDGGYGRLGSRWAHRVMYELMVGPIPEDLELDHLCHNDDLECRGGPTCPHRACVNPGHLDPTTGGENCARRPYPSPTSCPQGHAYDEENTYIRQPAGTKVCRACRREDQRARNRLRANV